MAIEYAGGPALTADEVRAESGVSCKPGVDTASGGLRILDVQRVAKAHGVTIDYGGLQSWPAEDLLTRLERGMGAIVLGDAARAPISPTPGVLYHSVFVHAIDAQGRTHWHDPRLSAASWVPLAKVLTYWGVEGGYRYAGFVPPAPPDTSTEASMIHVNRPAAGRVLGVATVRDAGTQLCDTERPTVRYPQAVGTQFAVIAGPLELVDVDVDGMSPPALGRREVYLLDDERPGSNAAFGLVSNFDVAWGQPTATLGTETSADGRTVTVTLKGG